MLTVDTRTALSEALEAHVAALKAAFAKDAAVLTDLPVIRPLLNDPEFGGTHSIIVENYRHERQDELIVPLGETEFDKGLHRLIAELHESLNLLQTLRGEYSPWDVFEKIDLRQHS